MRRVGCLLLAGCSLLAPNAVTAYTQEQLDRSRDPHVQALLSPQPKHVKILVVGDDGAPLPQVTVEHANLKDELMSVSTGKVQFNTSAPYFVLSLPGYEGLRVATADAGDYRAVLHKLPHGDHFRVCTDADLSARAPGWNGIFQLPKSKGTKATAEKFDVDYASRAISPKSGTNRVWVEQGRGPMWGGVPEDADVWEAVRVREFSYRLGDYLIQDEKAWMPDGKCKRSLGMFSESIVYWGLDCRSVQPIDDLMDQACAVPDALKHLF